jgi:hypothetical protein
MVKEKKSRIVVEQVEGGVRVRVDHAYSQEHAIWMLAQAIARITAPEEEVVTDEPVSELPLEDDEEEINLPDMQN